MTGGEPLTHLLIFPPVWVPIVPHLALPVLSSYLKSRGCKVAYLDANVEFFTDYLLSPATLSGLLERVEKFLRENDAPPGPLKRARDKLETWETEVRKVDDHKAVLRDEKLFFDPDRAVRAVQGLHDLLEMASLAYWPGRISFNSYRRGDIWEEKDLLDVCQNEGKNIFLPFFRERILPKIVALRPRSVGISISTVHQFIASMTLARLLRKTLPDVHVVVGGKHLLRIEKKILGHGFYFRDYFHSAVLHEGELPLFRILESLAGGRDVRGIPGVITWGKDGAEYVPPDPPLPLEDLPSPDFSEIQWEKYLVPRPYAPMRMSRGCYWGKCTFCIRQGSERFETLSHHRVIMEMEALGSAYRVKDFTVNDDCMPPEYWELLADGIIERGLEVSMLIWAKPVSGFTRQRLRKMAKAGVRQIRWGVESAHPRVLKLMRKGTRLDTMEEVLREAREAGIWNHCCFILGFPTETQREALRTISFIESQKDTIHSFILYPFVLYEDTHIFRHPEEFSITSVTRKETPFFDLMEYHSSKGMSPKEVASFTQKAKARLLGPGPKPFWYHIKLREYLQLYLDRFGLEAVREMTFNRDGLDLSWEGIDG